MPDLADLFRREPGAARHLDPRPRRHRPRRGRGGEAFAIAAEQWPTRMPPNPGGWITTARNRAVDRLQRESARTDRHRAWPSGLEADDMPPDHHPELDDLDGFVDVVADDQLRLMFLCCHPALAADAQVALAAPPRRARHPEIRPLVPDTLAQRIVPRQAQAARQPRALLRVPDAADLPDRLHAVLVAIYLVYTEGTRPPATASPASTSRVKRSASSACSPSSCPTSPKPSASSPSRCSPKPGGRHEPPPTDRWSAWPTRTARSGIACSSPKDASSGACLRRNQPGPFQIQAAIAAVHDAATAAATDWSQIVALYDLLYAMRPRGDRTQRAVAIGEMRGAAAGLDALDSLDVTLLEDYQPYHAARRPPRPCWAA